MAASAPTARPPVEDDAFTVCAISMLAAALADVLHEGVGHALLALLTGAQSGVISTVAWSSIYDSRLVAAGGTLVNLAAAIIFWITLRAAKYTWVQLRFFLLMSFTFNAFTGTGYFFFSGVTNFGDWAAVIAGMHPYWLWRTLLIVVGMASYYVAVLMVGTGLVRYLRVPLEDHARMRKLTLIPYLSATLLLAAGGLLNPAGIQFVWESALPAAAGADCGLLWLRYYIPKNTVPYETPEGISRSYAWMATGVIVVLVFIFILGRGITLHR
jgi:hypothetical protein